MPFLDIGKDGKVHYEHFAGSGVPIVLIHGWAMSTRIWSSMIEGLLRAGHEVVAIDQRGCGLSDRGFAEVSIEACAADAAAIVRALDLRPCVVNGWSLGGATAAETVRLLGPRAAGLVLTCGVSPRLTACEDFPHGAPAGSYAGIGDALLADRAGFFRGIAGATCAMDVGPATVDWMWSIFMDSGPCIYRALTGAEGLDQRALLAALEIPVLAFVGGSDAIVSPEIGRQAAALARDGTLHEFPACGHAPFLEQPAAYLEVLTAFAQRCTR